MSPGISLTDRELYHENGSLESGRCMMDDEERSAMTIVVYLAASYALGFSCIIGILIGRLL